MLEKLITGLLDNAPLVRTNLPRAGRVTLRHQAEQNRDIVHLLFAQPSLRGRLRGDNVQPIQDFVTLPKQIIDLDVKRRSVASVYAAPERRELTYRVTEDRLQVELDGLTGSAQLVVQYR